MEHGEQGREEDYKTEIIPKGRRTKRFRPPFSPALQDGSSFPSNGSQSQVVGSSSPAVGSPSPPLSPLSQESFCEHTEEEQAVASYLLLLSNGHESPCNVTPISEAPPLQFTDLRMKNNTSKQISPDGHVSYRCSTCGRDFPSFQALGGHRASHKKPKLAQPKNDYNYNRNSMIEIRKVMEEEEEEEMLKLKMSSFSTAAAKTRVHQCNVCSAEFTSGQALGGHMRRHRTSGTVPETAFSDIVAPDTEIKEETEIFKEIGTSSLTLDLNLPAPLEERRATPLVLSPEVHF